MGFKFKIHENNSSTEFFFLLIFVLSLNTVGICMAAKDYQEAGLKAHNKYRAMHQVDALELSSTTNDWADKCAEHYSNIGTIDHSCTDKNRCGENLWMRTGGQISEPVKAVEAAVKGWYSEVKDYNFENPDENEKPDKFFKIGHFSQLVWKGSKTLGIGYKYDGMTQSEYVVGLYCPAGNVQSAYKENVFPKKNGKNSASAIHVKAIKLLVIFLAGPALVNSLLIFHFLTFRMS